MTKKPIWNPRLGRFAGKPTQSKPSQKRVRGWAHTMNGNICSEYSPLDETFPLKVYDSKEEAEKALDAQPMARAVGWIIVPCIITYPTRGK